MKLRNVGYAALVAVTAVIIALGSAAPGMAKGKKKMAAPAAPPPAFCTEPYAPVCGVKSGMKNTYANACFARMDGAKVVSHKACATMKPGKPHKAKKAMKAKPAKKADKKPMEKKPMEKKPAAPKQDKK